MQQPIAIRPTSETVMYSYFQKWIQSHRDLPLKLYQWCNVVRWEFSQPTPFIRAREFLWKEGHCAFLTREEAQKNTSDMIDMYRSVYEDLLAVPVIRGRKSEEERFAGAEETWSVEAFIPENGRGIQAATSHLLGQNFSKMFDITTEDPDPDVKDKIHVWQTSWGISTRSLGVLFMIHSDNLGLVLPPRVAEIQVVIIPCGINSTTTQESKKMIYEYIETLKEIMYPQLTCHADLRDNMTPGAKFNEWESKGIPIQISVGPKESEEEEITLKMRHNRSTITLKTNDPHFEFKMRDVIRNINKEMFENAKKKLDEATTSPNTWEEFTTGIEDKKLCLVPWCESRDCEDRIKKSDVMVGVRSLCIPDEQPVLNGETCITPQCDKLALCRILFAKSY